MRIERVLMLAMAWGVVGASGCLHGSPEALPEVCNGIDDDLDGRVDEGRPYILDGAPRGTLICGAFPKNPGSGDWVCEDMACVVRCIAGKVDINDDPTDGCEADCTPSETGVDVCLAELPDECRDNCDNYDDDCDGRIDEDRGYPLSRLPGVCADTPMVCDGGWSEADHGRVSARQEPQETRCDGLDNDCDGYIDEGIVACDNDCDGIDDDGDGRVDEAWVCAETNCAANTRLPPCNGCPEGTVIPGRDPVGGEWVCVPAGEFILGSPDDEEGRFQDEGPQVPVNITRPLLVQTHETTWAQWHSVFGNAPPFLEGCDDCPVGRVNWFEVVAYVNRLSITAGFEPCYVLAGCGAAPPGEGMECDPEVDRIEGCEGYRLPTEAEWEYFARGDTTTRFWSGDTEEDLARAGRYWHGSPGGHHPMCTPPFVSPHHPWGLCDVHGGVWEWTESWWGLYPDPPADGALLADPLGPPRTGRRVMRGGSRRFEARYMRAAYRGRAAPDYRSQVLGFRPIQFAGPAPRARQ